MRVDYITGLGGECEREGGVGEEVVERAAADLLCGEASEGVGVGDEEGEREVEWKEVGFLEWLSMLHQISFVRQRLQLDGNGAADGRRLGMPCLRM